MPVSPTCLAPIVIALFAYVVSISCSRPRHTDDGGNHAMKIGSYNRPMSAGQAFQRP
jgi:hypothetical protein